jgi:hypothetical protein
MRRRAVFLLFVTFVGALQLSAQSGNPHGVAAGVMTDSVRRYLVAALDTFQRVSIHRDSVDWQALRDSVFARANGATTTDQTWRTLQWALRRVDQHSFMQTPHPMPPDAISGQGTSAALPTSQAGSKPATPPSTKPAGPPAVEGRMIGERIGYLLVPWFNGANRPPFVDSLQALIKEFDTAHACGWIIDLRKDQGGNMWPMLAGVGPLLGDSIVGAFYDGTSKQGSLWRYRDGHAWSGPNEMPASGGMGSLVPYQMRNPLAPVALLIGASTGSAGEATLLAFLGRPDTRSFGDTTAGYNSVNNGYLLSDGANMVITVGYSRDRLGRTYALKVAPDERIVPSDDPARDAPLDRAVAWLARARACAGRD